VSDRFGDQECAALYLAWRLGRPLDCPECQAFVNSADAAKPGWSRTRRFTCEGCDRAGVHLVPDEAPRALREKPTTPLER
jgi:hypothetical protein